MSIRSAVLGGRPRPVVLIIDHDQDSRELYCDWFESHGITAVAAGDAIEAYEAARRTPPDAVVTELALPGIDGIEICRTFGRMFARRVPVIVLTAFSGAYYTAQAKIAGAARVMTKPLPPDDLQACVEDVVRGWPAAVRQAADLRRAVRSIVNNPDGLAARHSGLRRSAVAQTGDGTLLGRLLVSDHGLIQDADLGAAQLTGYATDDLVGSVIWDFCPPGVADEYRGVWRWFLSSRRLRGSVSFVVAGGAVRPFQYESLNAPAVGTNVCAFAPPPEASAIVTL